MLLRYAAWSEVLEKCENLMKNAARLKERNESQRFYN